MYHHKYQNDIRVNTILLYLFFSFLLTQDSMIINRETSFQFAKL